MRCIILVFLLSFLSCTTFGNEPAPPLPATTSDWLDGKQLQSKDLKGKIVLLNVWTFGCWNSYRSLPWLVSLNSRFPQLQMIGVHSPEFAYERDRNGLRKAMAKYRVTYPQVLDDDMKYWRRLNNRYWPAFYVVDGNGRIRGKFVGETHAGDSQAKRIEELIQRLTEEGKM
jgi:hypothetical protein